ITKLVRRGETLVSGTRQSKRRNNWAVRKQPRKTLMNHQSVTSSFLQSRKAFLVLVSLLSAFDTAHSSLLFHSQRARHSGRPAAPAATIDELHRVETGHSRPRLVGSRRIASESV